ncbi:hypothetical protein EZS27_012843, partial [termite gut metagenome]
MIINELRKRTPDFTLPFVNEIQPMTQRKKQLYTKNTGQTIHPKSNKFTGMYLSTKI